MVPIPSFLVGEFKDVQKAVKRAAKAAMSAGSWDGVLQGSKSVSLESCPKNIVTVCYLKRTPKIDGIIVYTLFNALDIGGDYPDRLQWYEKQARLIDEGLDHFWFALCWFAAGMRTMPYMDPPLLGSNHLRTISARHLRKFLNWAETFDEFRGRFINCEGDPCPSYESSAFYAALDEVGDFRPVEILRPLSMVQRREVVLEWIAKF
jgi:hypothetical protein